MSNLRILHDNAVDRAATLTASSTAGSLIAANLQTDRKGAVHRSAATSVTYTLTWPAAETLAAVVLPACNLTPEAAMRVQAWDAEAGGTQLLDTGPQLACPGLARYGSTTAVDFQRGLAAKSMAWFAPVEGVRRLQIDIADPHNPAGSIDCARLLAGAVWSPEFGAGYGAQYQCADGSTISRAESGDLIIDRGPTTETLSFSLESMTPADRAEWDRIARLIGSHRRIWVTLDAGATDAGLLQAASLYGIRKPAPFGLKAWRTYDTTVQLEGW